MSELKGTSSHVSKLDIIENHIVASIQMIALGVNPISTHVIAMACEEMILSVADARNVLLDSDYRIYVRDKIALTVLVQGRNYETRIEPVAA